VPDPHDVPPSRPALVHSGPDLQVWVLPCGRISAHPAHVEFRGPSALALPAILAGRRRVPWMPINTVLVRHRTGTVLVDTGERTDPPPGTPGSTAPTCASRSRRTRPSTRAARGPAALVTLAAGTAVTLPPLPS
jgi:hypothetical protein